MPAEKPTAHRRDALALALETVFIAAELSQAFKAQSPEASGWETFDAECVKLGGVK